MNWDDPQGWLTWAFSANISTIVFTLLVALSLPLLLHYLYIYRTQKSTTLPTFLLIGPSGSGKTSLLTLCERGTPSSTHLSQSPLSVEVALPSTIRAASSKYRSTNDPSAQSPAKLFLVDTPGHGKLRHHALNRITASEPLSGIIFLADAANLSSSTGGRADEGLTEAGEYLHDVLLALQKRYTSATTSKGPAAMPVLVAANKLDLFTALPPQLVRAALEAEITRVRTTRAKGLLDSGIGAEDAGAEDERDWLGDGGEGKFEFAQMEEVNVPVSVLGGNVLGSEGSDVQRWWEWIAEHL